MKLVNTKDYLLLVDEEAECPEDSLAIFPNIINGEIIDFDECEPIKCKYTYVANGIYNLHLVSYYPITKEAKELDLPLLPNPFEDISYDELEIKYYQELEEKRLSAINFRGQIAGRHPDNLSSREIHAKVSGFIEGYKASQSKQFSLEDMRRCYEGVLQNVGTCITQKDLPTFDQYIQSLSTQQLPKGFIPEYESYEVIGKRDEDGYPLWAKRLKIITNPEGEEELVGTYR